MFSYVSPEQRIPKEHPLRAICALVDDVLRDMSRELIDVWRAELLAACGANLNRRVGARLMPARRGTPAMR